MMQKVLLATTNKGKQKEYSSMLGHLGFEVITLNDLEPMAPDVEEDGLSFEENAVKKAKAYSQYYQMPTIADDSGLEVDALGGRPGVLSARYAGPKATDADNITKLLEELKNVPLNERTARFVCVIAYINGDLPPLIARGICSGLIGFEPKGAFGFGYDPVFYLPQYGKTMAELLPEEKNKISHRAQALDQFVRQWKDNI
jgi:XTP/dITP diphosphohydrolase